MSFKIRKKQTLMLFSLTAFSLSTKEKEPETKMAKIAQSINPNAELLGQFWDAFRMHNKNKVITLFKQIPAPKLNTPDLTIIFFAVFSYDDSYSDMITALIEAGANINQGKISTKSTPLMAAASLGKINMVKTLLDAGANVSARNNQNFDVADFVIQSPNLLPATKQQLLDIINTAINNRRLINVINKQQTEKSPTLDPTYLQQFGRK